MVKFILTKELGRLARWLRILGFDTYYYTSDNMGTLIIYALRENRVIVTRRKRVDDMKVVVVETNDVRSQIRELVEKLKLKIDESLMFSRCVICNEPLEKVDKEEIRGKVPEYVYISQQEFYRCSSCQRLYWQGSHWGNVKEILKKVLAGNVYS
ncbi:MAG: hypothetical protein DRP72_02210 [Candidatus Omnitrophota bacterium]|nr:MAG: hypothetical protein DRP72_02210 [Candidatus Omnitrophota bacterium]